MTRDVLTRGSKGSHFALALHVRERVMINHARVLITREVKAKMIEIKQEIEKNFFFLSRK